jgi:hypothetical protein
MASSCFVFLIQMKSHRLFLFVLLLLFANGISVAAASLIIPVQLTIENGSYENTFVNVKKNGESIYSLPGEKNLRLKLELNSDYLLSFSKNGYITKQIHVRTDIPEERVRGGLDPYKIGVRLFKQYEGVNIVVYNQPVAFIRYLVDTDEMGYDVDYTKSIMSDLQEAETKLEQKAKEERDQLAVASKDQNKKSEIPPAPNNSNQVASIPQAKQEIQNNSVLTTPLYPDKGSEKIIPPVQAKLNEGSDRNNPSLSPALGQDEGHTLNMSSGSDNLKSAIAIASGEEKALTQNKVIVETTKSVSVSDEPNRKVTTVLIGSPEHVFSYKKIEYKWGGKFYFKDDKTSISDQMFFLFTGIN